MLVTLSPNKALPQRQPSLKRSVSSADNLHKRLHQLETLSVKSENDFCDNFEYSTSFLDKRGHSPISSAFACDLQSSLAFLNVCNDTGRVEKMHDTTLQKSRYTLFRQKEERRLDSRADLDCLDWDEHESPVEELETYIEPARHSSTRRTLREPSKAVSLDVSPVALQQLPASPRSTNSPRRKEQGTPLSAATRHARVMRRRSQASDPPQLGRLLQLSIKEEIESTVVSSAICPARTSFIIARDLHERANSCGSTNVVLTDDSERCEESSLHVLPAVNQKIPFYSQFSEMISAISILSQLSASTNTKTIDPMFKNVGKTRSRNSYTRRKYKRIFAGWC